MKLKKMLLSTHELSQNELQIGRKEESLFLTIGLQLIYIQHKEKAVNEKNEMLLQQCDFVYCFHSR